MSRELERIALISDVHGNLTALQAVLADIDARGITRIFNLGDYVGKGPRGSEVTPRTPCTGGCASTTTRRTGAAHAGGVRALTAQGHLPRQPGRW